MAKNKGLIGVWCLLKKKVRKDYIFFQKRGFHSANSVVYF